MALTLPIYYFGIPGGNDLPQHFRFVYSFYDAVHNGEIYPALPGDTNLGFGDLGIRFYPPLAYYAVVLFRSFTESWTAALAAAICFWFFVGGLGVFLLARESFSEKASVAAAIVFMAMPYHANQVYNAGLFAEFAGLAILPFCFLFVSRTISKGKMTDVAGLAIAYALLILTHLPLAIIGSLGLMIYAVALLGRRFVGASVLKLGSAVMIALAASAFYWVRMVWELNFVNHTLPKFTDRSYDFRLNFLASIFYLPASEYGETSLWFTDLLFAITLAMIVPALLAVYISNKGNDKRRIVPFMVVLVVGIFLSTPLSILLWKNIGTLAKIQFPWRFLGLISLAGSVLIAACVDELPTMFRTKLRPVGLVAVGLIIAGFVFTAAQVIRPANYSSRIEFDKNFERYKTDESYESWWPVWANRAAFADREQVSSKQRSVSIVKWNSDDREFVVGDGVEQEMRVATFYYPFWNATTDGENAEVTRDEDGTMLITVPPRRSTVRLFFAPPAYEFFGRYLSLFTWGFLIVCLVVGLVSRFRQRELG